MSPGDKPSRALGRMETAAVEISRMRETSGVGGMEYVLQIIATYSAVVTVWWLKPHVYSIWPHILNRPTQHVNL